MAKKPKEERQRVVLNDTGDIEFLGRPHGKRAAVVTWPLGSKPERGRASDHDWERMLYWLVAKVSKEGGLPQGRGGQAEVERWVHEWFDLKNLDPELSPRSTMVKDHVSRIYAEAKALKGR